MKILEKIKKNVGNKNKEKNFQDQIRTDFINYSQETKNISFLQRKSINKFKREKKYKNICDSIKKENDIYIVFKYEQIIDVMSPEEILYWGENNSLLDNLELINQYGVEEYKKLSFDEKKKLKKVFNDEDFKKIIESKKNFLRRYSSPNEFSKIAKMFIINKEKLLKYVKYEKKYRMFNVDDVKLYHCTEHIEEIFENNLIDILEKINYRKAEIKTQDIELLKSLNIKELTAKDIEKLSWYMNIDRIFYAKNMYEVYHYKEKASELIEKNIKKCGNKIEAKKTLKDLLILMMENPQYKKLENLEKEVKDYKKKVAFFDNIYEFKNIDKVNILLESFYDNDIDKAIEIYQKLKEQFQGIDIMKFASEIKEEIEEKSREDLSKNLNKDKKSTETYLEDDIKVYKYQGENFNILIHNALAGVGGIGYYFQYRTNKKSSINNKQIIKGWNSAFDGKVPKYTLNDKTNKEIQEILKNRRTDILCTSYINQDFLGHASSRGADELNFGYNNIEKDEIKIMGTRDLSTIMSGKNDEDTINTLYDTNFLPAKQMIKETDEDYNEVVIKRKKPDYIVCFDKINDISKEAAKFYKIPIKLIHTDKYIEKTYMNILKKQDYVSEQLKVNKIQLSEIIELYNQTMHFCNSITWKIELVSDITELLDYMQKNIVEFIKNKFNEIGNDEKIELMELVKKNNASKLYDYDNSLNGVVGNINSELLYYQKNWEKNNLIKKQYKNR